MSKTAKPREIQRPPKATQQTASVELDEKELQQVSGGKSCAAGQHIKTGKITVG